MWRAGRRWRAQVPLEPLDVVERQDLLHAVIDFVGEFPAAGWALGDTLAAAGGEAQPVDETGASSDIS